MENSNVMRARAAFPSGLEQPEGSYRFGSDALLLARFTAIQPLPENAAVADLGTGCGAAALALLLEKKDFFAAGVEIQPELAHAAHGNAAALGLEERLLVLEGDICCRKTLLDARRSLAAAPGRAHTPNGKDAPLSGEPLFDAVMCNPPWRLTGTGKGSPSAMREKALAGTEATLHDFFSAADALLKHRGLLTAVCTAHRLPDMLAALPPRLHPEHLRLVFTKADAPASTVLLMARKNGHAALTVDKLEMGKHS